MKKIILLLALIIFNSLLSNGQTNTIELAQEQNAFSFLEMNKNINHLKANSKKIVLIDVNVLEDKFAVLMNNTEDPILLKETKKEKNIALSPEDLVIFKERFLVETAIDDKMKPNLSKENSKRINLSNK